MSIFDPSGRAHLRRGATVAAVAAAVLATPFVLTTSVTVSAAAAASGDQVRVSQSWSGSRFVAGQRAGVSGSAQPASAVRRVVLQRRVGAGWENVRSVDPATARFAIRVPTGWYGTFDYRLRVLAQPGAVSTTGATKRIRVVAPYEPRGLASSYLLGSRPVARWDPCAVIDYRVNTTRARAGALQDVRGALRRVYRATGLRFAYRGRTGAVPQDILDAHPAGAELLIAWARPGESRMLSSSAGSPAGVGGAAWTSGYHNADGTAAAHIGTGSVVIDATQQRSTPAGFGSGQTRGELLMHEIGHAVGLQHVDDRRQIMYPTMQRGAARWGAGDLAGLGKLGANRGCLVGGR